MNRPAFYRRSFFLMFGASCLLLALPAQTIGAGKPKAPTSNMVLIQGGSFGMGSPAAESGRFDNEILHQVTVSSFFMGVYEVTQAEWMVIMGKNPSAARGERNPVEQVSWYHVLVYCNKRSVKDGLVPCYSMNGSTDPDQWGTVPSLAKNPAWDAVRCDFQANGYRLPTEAEWEYACRAGTGTPFNTGKNITTAQANYDGNNPYQGFPRGDFRQKPLPVGSYPPNAWGLCDMHGNVWEWCWDAYGSYDLFDQRDPPGSLNTDSRVFRGAGWCNFAQYLRSAFRGYSYPYSRFDFLGFRLVCRP